MNNIEKLAQLVLEMKKIQEIHQKSIKKLQENQSDILKLIKLKKEVKG